jgi:rhodanese-related sulfurtransferase
MIPLRRIVGCVVPVLVAAGCGGYQGPSSGRNRDLVPDPPQPSSPVKVRRLSPLHASRILRQDPNVFLLCVATREEYDRGHIAGSVLIPAMALGAKLAHNDLWPRINRGRTPRKDQPIIVYCWWKSCRCPLVPTYSGLAYKILHDKGYENLALIDGGMVAWKKAKLPVETKP